MATSPLTDNEEDALRAEARELAGAVGPGLEQDCAGCRKRGNRCAMHGTPAKKRKAAAPAPEQLRAPAAPADPGRFDPLVARTLIRRSPTNPRKTFHKLDELAESIRAHGIIKPLVVRPAPPIKKADGCSFELVAGERRHRAAELAGLEAVPCLIRELSDVQVLEIQIIENAQREDVHPLEEADGYRELLDKHGYTVDKIVEKTGKSKATVYSRLKLCDLGPEGRKACLEEGMHAEVALAVSRIPVVLQGQAVKAVMGRGAWDDYEDYGVRLGTIDNETHRQDPVPMSVRQAREYIRKRFMLRLELAKFDITDATLTKAGSCTACTLRTGNQPELFSDVPSADVCTNPPCYDEKTAAGFKVAAARARADGLEVVDGKKAEAMFYGHGGLTHEAREKYFDPKEDIPYDLDRDAAKSKTWSKALGKELAKIPKVIVQAPDGGARELFDRDQAVKVLREAGKLPKPSQSRSSSGSSDNGAAKRIADTKRRRLVVNDAMVHLGGEGAAKYVHGDGKEADKWWRWAVTRLVTMLGVEDQMQVAKAFKLEIPKTKGGRDGYEKALLKYAAELSIHSCRGLMIVLLSATGAAGSTWSSGYAKTFLEACERFGVDVKKLEANLVAQAKADKAAKGKGGTKGASKR